MMLVLTFIDFQILLFFDLLLFNLFLQMLSFMSQVANEAGLELFFRSLFLLLLFVH